MRTAAPLLTQEELEHNLITASGELDTLAVISVDGKQTAIAADTDGAQAALDRIKAASRQRQTKRTLPADRLRGQGRCASRACRDRFRAV